MFLKTFVLQICSKFTEHPRQGMISIKLVCNFTLLYFTYTSGWYFPICLFAENIFWRTPMGDCFWICNVIKLDKIILKSLWYFVYLNYPLLLKLFFYNNWCNYLIFMYEISQCWEWIVVYYYEKKNIQSYLETLLKLEIIWGGFFLKHLVYLRTHTKVIIP